MHVAGKLRFEPGTKHKPIHLIENDLGIFEDRFPAEAINVKTPRTREIGNTKCNDRNLLLHLNKSPLCPVAQCDKRTRRGTWRKRQSEPHQGGDRANLPVCLFRQKYPIELNLEINNQNRAY